MDPAKPGNRCNLSSKILFKRAVSKAVWPSYLADHCCKRRSPANCYRSKARTIGGDEEMTREKSGQDQDKRRKETELFHGYVKPPTGNGGIRQEFTKAVSSVDAFWYPIIIEDQIRCLPMISTRSQRESFEQARIRKCRGRAEDAIYSLSDYKAFR